MAPLHLLTSHGGMTSSNPWIFIDFSDFSPETADWIFSNFTNFWSWELKFLQESDLVLKRTNPGSFFDPMIFGTPCGHSSENLRDFLVQIMILFLDQKFSKIFRTMTRGCTKNHQMIKTPRI